MIENSRHHEDTSKQADSFVKYHGLKHGRHGRHLTNFQLSYRIHRRHEHTSPRVISFVIHHDRICRLPWPQLSEPGHRQDPPMARYAGAMREDWWGVSKETQLLLSHSPKPNSKTSTTS